MYCEALPQQTSFAVSKIRAIGKIVIKPVVNGRATPARPGKRQDFRRPRMTYDILPSGFWRRAPFRHNVAINRPFIDERAASDPVPVEPTRVRGPLPHRNLAEGKCQCIPAWHILAAPCGKSIQSNLGGENPIQSPSSQSHPRLHSSVILPFLTQNMWITEPLTGLPVAL